ncbi:hypothetical protein PBRA_007957 [Plasmodiophora brassicae]|uniref:Uncharacterized protein n=1 Tax=Plasmodiophora brassicae TaxID=37360 RepID=A0A0G4IY11_PLABS|nr:hypothetical protein PBRA_007957 [Plasmodiophora brassicae]
MHGRSTYRTLILAVALSGLLQAITLRSHDGGDGHVVSTPAAVAHSGLFGNLIGDRDEWCCDDDVFTLPAMNTGADVLMIAEFVNNTDAHDTRLQVDTAARWARDRLHATDPQTRARLLAAADYLDMRLLIVAIASSSSSCGWRDDLPAMHRMLSRHLLRFVAGLVRVGHVQRTGAQASIVKQTRGLVVGAGNATFVNSAVWDRDRGHNLLHWAASQGEESIVELLVIHAPGIDVVARDAFNRTALHLAASQGNAGVVELLLKASGVDVNARDATSLRTPLHLAVLNGHTDVVEVFVAAVGIDVNGRDASQMTPLRLAVDAGRADVVDVLVRAPGIDVNAVGKDQQTALQVAQHQGRADLVALLLAAAPGVDVNRRTTANQDTALHLAVADGRADLVALLLAAPGIDVNARDGHQYTPLHLAVLAGRADMVDMLLAAPAIDANAGDRAQRTPLHLAVSRGRARIVERLVGVPGVNVTASDADHRTPLQMAEASGRLDIVIGLLDSREMKRVA